MVGGKSEEADSNVQVAEVSPEVHVRTNLALEGNPGPGEDSPVPPPARVTSQEEVTIDGFPHVTMGDGIPAKSVQDRALAIEQRLPGVLAGVNDKTGLTQSAVIAADRLTGASPKDAQRIFAEAIALAAKDHPEAEPGVFTRALRIALREHESGRFDELDDGTVGMLTDILAVSPDNPRGVIARAFVGEYAETLNRDREAFNAASEILKLQNSVLDSVPEGDQARLAWFTSEMTEQLMRAGMFAPVPDVGPHVRPEDAPNESQQAALIGAKFSLTLDNHPTGQQWLKETVAAANVIAFADPKDQQQLLIAAFDTIAVNNPGAEPRSTAKMFVYAMNLASGADNYSTYNDDSLTLFADKRLSTASNPNGNMVALLTEDLGFGDAPFEKLGLQTALATAALIRQHAIIAGPDTDINHFHERTQNALTKLKF